MRIGRIMKPIAKVAGVVGPVVSIAEGVSFVYDVATYKKRARREYRERDEMIRNHVVQTYAETKEARETYIRNEVHAIVKEELPAEVTAQLQIILLEKERREKEKKNGQNTK